MLIMCGTVFPQIFFEDVSKTAGLDVSHISTAENRYIVESMSGGAAVFDCNDDGLVDIATVNGSSVKSFLKGGDPFIALFVRKNAKDLSFEDKTKDAGLLRKGWGMGINAVDYDNDGILDIFVTGFEGNALYKGLGGCKYKDVTEATGPLGTGFLAGAAWADYDKDGDLDVFISGYVTLDLNKLPVFGGAKNCSYRGIRVQCGPRGLPGKRDYLFRNEGKGKFTDISKEARVIDTNEYFGLGVVWSDLDNDGWLDLFVANDSTPNYLYRNKKNGKFEDISFESGVSFSGEGDEQSSMGITVEDVDRDGDFDIFLTHFESEYNTLYFNLMKNGFLDRTAEAKLSIPARPYVGWGTAFIDFDHDTWLDLFTVNGHVYPQMDLVKEEGVVGFKQKFLVQRNKGDGTFEDVTKVTGLDSLTLESRRGAAFADFNQDGKMDVVVTNLGAKPTLLINRTKLKGNSITISVAQKEGNRAAIGARVVLDLGKYKLMREVKAGESYLSQNEMILHFGVGEAKAIRSVTVTWPDGSKEEFKNLKTGFHHHIVKGSKASQSRAFSRE